MPPARRGWAAAQAEAGASLVPQLWNAYSPAPVASGAAAKREPAAEILSERSESKAPRLTRVLP